jgi:hypothetical protein
MIEELLTQHPGLMTKLIREAEEKASQNSWTFPEVINWIKKPVTRPRKKPAKPGDAPPGREIDANEQQAIRDLIVQLGKEEAWRRNRNDPGPNSRAELGQFNRRFNLSAHNRLPKTQFELAIKQLNGMLLTRRTTEAKFGKVDRERKGIGDIAQSLGWSLEDRRSFCGAVTGKRRLGQMSPQEINTVYLAMLRRQDPGKAA